MPIYEFFCEPCDETFEELLPMSRSKDAASCPRCGKKSARCLSAFAAPSSSASSSLPGSAGQSCSTCGAEGPRFT